ncbi:MAG: hypothetical protein ACREVS_02435 [Burkholderiales bacterium]
MIIEIVAEDNGIILLAAWCLDAVTGVVTVTAGPGNEGARVPRAEL